MLYVNERCLKSVNGTEGIPAGSVVLLDASSDDNRDFTLQTRDYNAGVILELCYLLERS